MRPPVTLEQSIAQAERALLVGFLAREHRGAGPLPLVSIRAGLELLDELPPIYQQSWILEAAAESLPDLATGAELSGLAQGRVLTELLRDDDDRTEPEQALRQLAEAGDAAAARNVAVVLAVRDNSEEAESWLYQAAERGDVLAAIVLGLWLSEKQESADARRWFRQAVELGEVLVGSELSIAEGRGAGEAARWLQLAAEKEPTSSAAVSLGLLSLIRGAPVEAERWLREAARGGDTAAMVALAVLLAERGEREARRWLWEAAEAGDAAAAVFFASLLRDDPDAAARWLAHANQRAGRGIAVPLGSGARPFALQVVYGSPLTAVVAFSRSLVNLPGWLDGLAKLMAMVGSRQDLIEKHRQQIKLDRMLAEQAIERALADGRTHALRSEFEQAQLRLALVQVGTVDELLPRGRELAAGEDVDEFYSSQ